MKDEKMMNSMSVNQIAEIASNGNQITILSSTALMLAKIAIAANNHEIAKKEFTQIRAGCISMLGIEKGVECAQYKTADKKLYDAEMALTEALIYAKVEGLFCVQENNC